MNKNDKIKEMLDRKKEIYDFLTEEYSIFENKFKSKYSTSEGKMEHTNATLFEDFLFSKFFSFLGTIPDPIVFAHVALTYGNQLNNEAHIALTQHRIPKNITPEEFEDTSKMIISFVEKMKTGKVDKESADKIIDSLDILNKNKKTTTELN